MDRRRGRALLLASMTTLALLATACAGTSTTTATPGATAAPVSARDAPSASPGASSGCRIAPHAPGRTTVRLSSGGHRRSYDLYVPSGLRQGRPAPVVLDLTPYSPASLEEGFSGFTLPDRRGRVKADQVGAVVVTPTPINGSGKLRTWNYMSMPGFADDKLFITDLLHHVEATTCVDRHRVLLMGFAVGAVFGSILACEQPGRYAALVTVSGLYHLDNCPSGSRVPVLSFHGTGDRFVPFDRGVGPGADQLGLTAKTIRLLFFMAARPGAIASSRAWAKQDGCGPRASNHRIAPTVVRKTWRHCDKGQVVQLYVIEGAGHTWPNSNGYAAFTDLLGPVSRAVHANDVLWRFFQAHSE